MKTSCEIVEMRRFRALIYYLFGLVSKQGDDFENETSCLLKNEVDSVGSAYVTLSETRSLVI